MGATSVFVDIIVGIVVNKFVDFVSVPVAVVVAGNISGLDEVAVVVVIVSPVIVAIVVVVRQNIPVVVLAIVDCVVPNVPLTLTGSKLSIIGNSST